MLAPKLMFMFVCLGAGSTDLVTAMATDKEQERAEIKDCKIIIIILGSALSLALVCIVAFIVYTRCKNKGDNSCM